MKKIINVKLNETEVRAEVDTGCPIILIGSQLYRQKFIKNRLQHFNRPLYAASGHQLCVLGSFNATIAANGRRGKANVVVQSINRELPLLGADGLDVIFPNWRKTFDVNSISKNDHDVNFSNLIKSNFKSVCDGNLSESIKDFTVDLHLNPDSTPIFARARPLPYGMTDVFSRKIAEMVRDEIIVPVKDSARENLLWASPVVVVKKPNGSIRICIDPKRTLNPYLVEDHYPLPMVEDLLVKVGARQFYSLIDLTGAFQQLRLTPEASKLVSINTPLGLFQYTRMPFGIKTASAIFQRFMDEILKDCPWASAYIDDVIVTASSAQEMRDRLIRLFEVLQRYNVKVNISKCVFCVTKVKYLGHEVSMEGIFPSKDKMSEILQLKHPSDVKELQSFLGLVNYFQKFIPHLSQKLSPILELLKSGVQFRWADRQQEAFLRIKDEFRAEKMLAHFDSRKEPVICCDASDKGISAVLCHEVEGTLSPVMFKSRTLTPAEKNYPILHRELLAVVFGFEKFYKYVLGKCTRLLTDHKPLLPILKSGLNLATVTTRVQRYLLRLNPYDFQVSYVQGKMNALADFPSRFPTEGLRSGEDEIEEKWSTTVNCLEEQQDLNFQLVEEHCRRDKLSAELRDALKHGKKFDKPQLKPFSAVRDALTVRGDVILHDGRIVIPESLQSRIVDMLHEQHLGIVRMKQLARRYFFWPGLSAEIEQKAKSCEACKSFNVDTARKIFIPWPEPHVPFERVHIDFFHLDSRTFLIMVDSFSRWVEVVTMRKTDAQCVIDALFLIFTKFGDPRTLVSDNGPPFNSAEFKSYCDKAQIKLLHSPPYNPQSNGTAERWVRTVKEMMKKNLSTSFSESRLQHLLFTLRNSPTTDGDLIPSQRILAFKPRDRFSKVLPPLTDDENSLERRVGMESNLPAHRSFQIGDTVMLKSQSGPRVRCQIVGKLGNAVYTVQGNGVHRMAHANQLVRITGSPEQDVSLSSEPPSAPMLLRPRDGLRPPNRYAN